ncbi:MAG: hypothetical protein M0034_06490 [Deltaproteobacteria bacterium]|nr:hypothetical protein [Deltaproteobacteria bacterium]
MSIFNLIFKSKIRYYNINSFIYCIILFIIIFYTDFAALSSYGINYSPLKKYTVKKRLWVHKLKIKSGIIYKLNTAPGYVSVITLPVIPLDVALGNTGAFSEQIVGRQIFIKPATYDYKETSNLEIYTKYGLINVLLRIRSPKSVTYNLNIADTIKDVFVKNYVKNKINGLKAVLLKKYDAKNILLDKKAGALKREKKEVMGLILMINRKKVNASITKGGITLTVISVSRIKNLYYLQYRLTNNTGRSFFVRNVYLYKEYGGNFFNGYAPDKLKEIPPINRTPHNAGYMPYKIIKDVIIFKRKDGGSAYSGGLKVSFHILKGKKLIKLKIGGIQP